MCLTSFAKKLTGKQQIICSKTCPPTIIKEGGYGYR
nr:MAG TPA: hypothetical protein [Caudoviricetes sp.]